MNIQKITESITTNSDQVYQNLKSTVLWSGHAVNKLFWDSFIPALQTFWKSIHAHLGTLTKQAKTCPGITFALAGCLLLCGIAAFKVADAKTYEEDRVAKTAWKVIGITAFVGSTVVTSFGLGAFFIL